jgi:O-methyltransferase involved in polyketide biosynthesis
MHLHLSLHQDVCADVIAFALAWAVRGGKDGIDRATGGYHGDADATSTTPPRGRGVIDVVADPIRRTRTHGFDARVAAPARVYDYWLGGKDNFAADRIAGEAAIDAYPAIRLSARANRAFLKRAVSFLAAEQGVRQFLDIGAGLPTVCNTHEIAQSIAPASRVVYVDNDPMVVCHAQALLSSTPQGITACVGADLRDTAAVLTQAAEDLDFTRPVAVMLLAVLDHIPDLDQARGAVARLMAAVPAGSFLVISHAASDIDTEEAAEMIGCLNRHLAERNYVGRPRDVVARFFDGLELAEPGVVKVTQWHPRSWMEARGPTSLWGGVARRADASVTSSA